MGRKKDDDEPSDEEEEEEFDDEEEEEEEFDDDEEEDSDEGDEDEEEKFDKKQAELELKRDRIAAKKRAEKDGLSSLSQNERIEYEHSRKAIRQSGYLFTAPLVPAVMSLFTILFGNVILNTGGVGTCSTRLDVYLVGQIALSYILLALYGSLYIGCGSFRWQSFTGAKVAAIVFCVFGFAWNCFGTSQVSSGSSCAVTTPALYSFCRAEMIGFWMCVGGYLIAFVKNWYTKKFADNRADQAAKAERIRKLREQDEEYNKIAHQEEEAKREEERKQQEEADKLRLEREAKEAKQRELEQRYSDSSDDDEASQPPAHKPHRPGKVVAKDDDSDEDAGEFF